ncbi:matrixin family metalloprotease [Candidatus Bipolaricaulota bacterium]
MKPNRRLATRWLLPIIVAAIAVFVGVLQTLGVTEEMDLEELTAASAQIINGRVTNMTSYWDVGRIFTDVTIDVLGYVLGFGPSSMTVRVPGGIVGEIMESVSDVPHFELGQEVILFLRDVYFEVVGWSQGKFTVEDKTVVETGQSKSEFIEDIVAIESRLGLLPEKEKGGLEARTETAVEVFEPQLPTGPISSSANGIVDSGSEDTVSGGADDAWTTITVTGFGDFPYGLWNAYAQSGYASAYWDDVSTTQDPDTKVYSGIWSCYCADLGAAAVWPPGPYPANMRTWMIYGPFSLADAFDAELLFYYWSRTESDYDYFKYLASVDGSTFYGYQMSGDHATGCGGYCSTSFDLTNVPILGNLCGQSQVWIAFLFTSDVINQFEGTYIDDVILRKDTTPPPSISSISPISGPAHALELGSSTSAADSTLVTISGSNFGATQGTGYVRFWRVGSTYYNGSVTSWSDTQITVRVPGRVSSGNILVHADSGGDSNTKYFTVTYSYGGGKWPGPSPMKDTNWVNQQYYYVNANTSDTTGELAAFQAAADTWSDVAVADYNFRYGGTTGTAAIDFYDYTNVIFWNPSDTGSVATCHYWWLVADTNTLVQFDIEFNDASYSWATDGSAGNMDVQGIATHELGHTLNLLDLYGTVDTEKTMYGYVSTGETSSRTLHSTDIAGLSYMYPYTTPAVFRVDSGGNVLADGPFYGASFQTGAADVAEWVLVSEPVEPGDVLELDPDNPQHYRKTTGACSSLVAGVVSTQPGVVLGSSPLDFGPGTDDSRRETEDSALLALIGIVPVKACDEGGPIEPGDLLVPASIPGYVRRWDPERDADCPFVGKALESLESGTGMIEMLLMR